jgi:hypothetical protein
VSPVRRSGDLLDINSTCNILHVSRAYPFEIKDLFANPSAIVTAKKLFGQAQPSGNARWIGVGDENDVTSCSWHKDLESPMGVLQIGIKPRAEYMSILAPGDLLFVFMDDAGDYSVANRFNGTLITIAVIDRVGNPTMVANGATTTWINVNARDLGVILAETSTVFDQAFFKTEKMFFDGNYIAALFKEKRAAASPSENIMALMQLLFDYSTKSRSTLTKLQWQFRHTGDATTIVPLISLLDITSFVQVPMTGYTQPDTTGMLQSGNIWSFLESYANRSVNEFFVDVRDFTKQENALKTRLTTMSTKTVTPADIALQVAHANAVLTTPVFGAGAALRAEQAKRASGDSVMALVLRQRPYDTETFRLLPTTVIDETEVENDDTAISSHSVLNWFRVRFPTQNAELQEYVEGVYVNNESVARFGFRFMDAETRYMFLSSKLAEDFKPGQHSDYLNDVLKLYTSLFATWFAANDLMRDGTITMRFRPSIRCGTRIVLHKPSFNKTYEYYVQGVQHSWSNDPGASRTVLTVTRGVDSASTGIENQLFWDGKESHMPSTVYSKVTQAGFNPPKAGSKPTSMSGLNPVTGLEDPSILNPDNK